ncbi:hypothetical protein [Acetobacter papayae]|uniref:hypothetical protein n=1 Tax=Acetobacter papayae TaxID=1076592 RepID=UPI000B28D26D|nr:hypothetical protein [Acetobacter papayae]
MDATPDPPRPNHAQTVTYPLRPPDTDSPNKAAPPPENAPYGTKADPYKGL